MTRSLLAALLLVALALGAFAACGDDDDPAPTTAPTGTTAAGVGGATTGVAVVDNAIKAALAGDAAALSSQVRFKSLACATTPSGPIPGPPKCLAGQTDGTMVQAVNIGTGQSVYRQGSDLSEVWPNWFGPSRELYAVKRLSTPDDLGAIYHVVFLRPDKMGTTLSLSADGIVQIGFDPSFNARRQADGPTGTFIIPPK